MYCENCGKVLPDGARFCAGCGAPATMLDAGRNVDVRSAQEVPAKGQVTPNIYLCPDGVYRWTYEFDMLRTPTIFFTICKVVIGSFGAVYVFVLLLGLFNGSADDLKEIWGITWPFLILMAVFFVITVISYLIVAASFGWKYTVLFEMTGNYVRHIQAPKQTKKAEAIGWLSIMAGLASGSPSQVGLGLMTASRNSSTSEFKNVKNVKVRPSRHTIYVNQLLNKNQVYAGDADFEFVRQFIVGRCVNAKIK